MPRTPQKQTVKVWAECEFSREDGGYFVNVYEAEGRSTTYRVTVAEALSKREADRLTAALNAVADRLAL